MLVKKENLNALKAWLEPEVVNRIKEKLRLSNEDANQLFEDLKLFLFIASSNDGVAYKKYRPSIAIDDAWHEFLLFTKNYRDFCIKVLGVFVDHTPGFDKNWIEGDSLITEVRKYSEKPSKFWFASKADCVSCWGSEHPDDADCSNDYSKDVILMPTTSVVKLGGVLNKNVTGKYIASSVAVFNKNALN